MQSTETTVGSIEAQYDWSETTPSFAVINAVAVLENVEPVALSTTLEATLFESVDPEALDALVTDGGPLAVSFSFEDYHVRIDGNTLIVSYD